MYHQLLTNSYLNHWNSVRRYAILSLQTAQIVAAHLSLNSAHTRQATGSSTDACCYAI